MTATDNLSPAQFYHGTTAELRPGSYVRPASQIGGRTTFPGYDSKDYAYATHSLRRAGEYAQLSQDWAYNQNSRPNRRVYEVTPTGEFEPDPDDAVSDAYRSKAPWKVVRRVPASEWNR